VLAIADDEDRHGELAWRMLAWAVHTCALLDEAA